MQHTIHHFKMYNFTVFSVLRESCNPHCYPVLEHSHPPRRRPIPVSNHFHFPFLQTPGNHESDLCMDLPVLDISYEWKHRPFVPGLFHSAGL